jgi:hypothetical protein
MKSKLFVTVILLVAGGVMFVISTGLAVLIALVGAGWGVFATTSKAVQLLAIIGLPPLALIGGMVGASKRPGLAGLLVVAGTLLSAGISSLTDFQVAQESMIVTLVWIPTGSLGLAMTLPGLAPGWRRPGRLAPEQKM